MDQPNTTSLWDQTDLTNIATKVANLILLSTNTSVIVADIGAGNGRFLKAVCEQLKDRRFDAKIQYLFVEPDINKLNAAKSSFEGLKHDSSVISVDWIATSAEDYLLSQRHKIDIVILSFVLHALPGTWCHVVNGLLSNTHGSEICVVFNEIRGKCQADQEMLDAVDMTYPFNRSYQSQSATSITKSYIKRMLSEGAAWVSSAKATDTSTVTALLSIMGLRPMIFDGESHIDTAARPVTLLNKHYAWAWGETSTPWQPFNGTIPEINVMERWYIFRGIPNSDQTQLESILDLASAKSRGYLAAFRPIAKSISIYSETSSELTSLSRLALSTLIGSGILNPKLRLASILLGNADLHLMRDVDRLESLLVLVNSQLDESLEKVWRLHLSAFTALSLPSIASSFTKKAQPTLVTSASRRDTLCALPQWLACSFVELPEAPQPTLPTEGFNPENAVNYFAWKGLSISYSELVSIYSQSVQIDNISPWFSKRDNNISNLAYLLQDSHIPYLVYIPVPGAWIGDELGEESYHLLCLAYKDFSTETIREIDRLKMHFFECSSKLVDRTYFSRWRAMQRVAEERASRAAVFARNFSHIIGSHVISSPGFRNALVGGELMNRWRDGLLKSHSAFVSAENNLYANMLESDANPAELWSRGTKVLDQANSDLRIGGVLSENTRRFHEYLQGRFDFIARAIDSTPDQSEPLWFVEDLVEGFLSQTAFLDYLVADIGLHRKQMKFSVTIKDGPTESPRFTAKWEEDKKTGLDEIKWRAEGDAVDRPSGKDIRDYATMVALPGGMVSAHALYSLLENIIRNSVKYGSRKNKAATEGYKLDLHLERQHGHFTLKIWDNLSGCGNRKDQEIQIKLEKDFVKPNGEQETEDLGALEMQACARLLCRQVEDENGGENPFPGERGTLVKDEKKASINLWVGAPHKTGSGSPGFPPSQSGERQALEGEAPAELSGGITQQSLPESEQIPGDGEALTFHLSLNTPVLLGVLGKAEATNHRKLSCRFGSLSAVVENWPHLLVLDGENEQESQLSKWLKCIREEHWKYPYRILVLSKNKEPESAKDWHKEGEKENVLNRRVAFCTCSSLYGNVFKEIPDDETGRKEAESAAILGAYEAWLRGWKGCGDGKARERRWHLWIGMERAHDQVSEAWKKRLSEFKSNLIQLGVRSHEEQCNTTLYPTEVVSSKPFGDSESDYWGKECAKQLCDKKALVFDNHGNCFEDLRKFENAKDFRCGPRFYQKLTGSLTPDLFRALSNPPKDQFAFDFFIHSLVEACLTNVMVVDERVAWNLVEGTEFAGSLANHQKAGVFPIFRFRQKGATDGIGFYNKAHQDRFVNCVETPKEQIKNEGVTFSDDAANKLEVLAHDEDGGYNTLPTNDKGLGCDVLLIHEGAMDILISGAGEQTEQKVPWDQEKDLPKIFQLAPAVVRTSGRGRKSKNLGEHLPFIEFGEVSSALLTSRNKFSLVRGLLGSAGHEMKPQTPK